MGSERAAQIANMESMGFERSQIDAAMRAAFYNSERAVEYLLNVRISRCVARIVLIICRVFQIVFNSNSNNHEHLPLLVKTQLLLHLLLEETMVAMMRDSTCSRLRLRQVDEEALHLEEELQDQAI